MLKLLPVTPELIKIINEHGEFWNKVSSTDTTIKIIDMNHGKEVIEVDVKFVEHVRTDPQ